MSEKREHWDRCIEAAFTGWTVLECSRAESYVPSVLSS